MNRLPLLSFASCFAFGLAAFACTTTEDIVDHTEDPRATSPGGGLLGEGGLPGILEPHLPGAPSDGSRNDASTQTTETTETIETSPPPPPPVAPFGCVLMTEAEPNDVKPAPMGAFVCGKLASPTDRDTFVGYASSKEQHVTVASTGDARFVIRGFGAEEEIDPKEGIYVPAFGSFAKYEIHVQSPSGALVTYRIDVKEE